MSRLLRVVGVLALVVVWFLMLAGTVLGGDRPALPARTADPAVVRPSTIPSITFGAEIRPDVPMLMGDTGVILEFAPGAAGHVTVTLIPTTPVGAPAGAVSLTWEITTTAQAYSATAAFLTHRLGRQAQERDIVLLVDKSGSMEWDTLCYGCWTPEEGVSYPDGKRWPLPWNGPAEGPPAHCDGTQGAFAYSEETYLIIEAEEYSSITPSYDRDVYAGGMTYWVIQRNGGTTIPSADLPAYMRNDYGGAGALGRDARGGYLHHAPYPVHPHGRGSNCTWDDLLNGRVCARDPWLLAWGGPFPTPRADYDFTVPASGEWHVWARGQAGDGAGNLMWGLGQVPITTVVADGSESFYSRTYVHNGADKDYWRWVKLGSMDLVTNTAYTLNIWAGACNFALDRLVITTNPMNPSEADAGVWDHVLNNSIAIDNHRTRGACNPCDARFGGYPGGPGGDTGAPHCVIPGFGPSHPFNYRYNDWIYDDEQPMRGTKEAFKTFVRALDSAVDQVGLVTYSSRASVDSRLQCLTQLGPACTSQVITDTVIRGVELAQAGGGTNTADALEEGLRVLSAQPAYGQRRAEAAHALVLMTDGEPNSYSYVDPACYARDYYPVNTGNTSIDRAKDCAVYYTLQALEQGVTVYVATLGPHVDIELAQYIAHLAGGRFGHAPETEHLDFVFDSLDPQFHLAPPATPPQVAYVLDDDGQVWRGYPLAQTTTGPFHVRVSGITDFSTWTLNSTQFLLQAAPPVLPADGAATATLTATFIAAPAPGTVVTFATSLGAVAPLTHVVTGNVATATLTAPLVPGTAHLTVTTGTVSATTWVDIVPLPPADIVLAVSPTTLPANGAATATLTATVTDALDRPVVDGTGVSFATDLGVVIPAVGLTAHGVATATLTGLDAGTAHLTATTGAVTTTGVVTFTPLPPRYMALTVVPPVLPANGAATAVLTATFTDALARPIVDGAVVELGSSLGVVVPVTRSTVSGVVTATLHAGRQPGHAQLRFAFNGLCFMGIVDVRAHIYLPLVLRP